jgi:hypothetical protein
MPYQTGSIITASDINALANSINKIRGDRQSGLTTIETGGFGYGQTDITSTASIGLSITAVNYSSFYTSLNQIARHLGRTQLQPPGDTVSIGQLIQAYPAFNAKLTELSNNRFSVATSNTSTTTGGNKLISSRSDSWNGSITHEIRANFTSLNRARYFFNSGGRIILTQTIGIPTTTADAELQSVFNLLSGTYLDYLDFYPISTISRQVRNYSLGSTSATVNVAFQSGIFYIRIDINSSNPAVYVSAPISSRVDERRSVNVFNVPGASYISGISLTDGGNVAAPFTGVQITGGGVKSCSYSTGVGCFVDFVLTANTTGGTGNFTYVWTLTDTTNYSILSGQGTSILTIRSATGTADLPPTMVSVVVTDLGINEYATAGTQIDANKVSAPTGVLLTVTGGNTQECLWDYDGSTYPTACFVDFVITATPAGGVAPFTYNWSSNNPNYSILSGQGTNTATIRSVSGTTNLPSAVITCNVTDTNLLVATGNTTITANRIPGPITDVIVTPNGGNSYSCVYNSPLTVCTVNSSYTTVVVGGSGNYTFTNLKLSGGSETSLAAFNASNGSFTVSTTASQ